MLGLELACVAWRFWLGALSNKGGRGQRNREEIGAEATWFLVFSRLRRSCARLDKTAMLRRLGLELDDYSFILLERTAHTNTPLAKNNDRKAKLLAEASHHFRQSSTAL